MCNFNNQSEDTKALIHLFLTKAAENVGGVNPLLVLLEAIKEQKPQALTSRACKVESEKSLVVWNKVIFKDKFDVLEAILVGHRSSEDPDFNILNNDNQKQKKKILNMVKTLAPIEFIVTPTDANDGGGFNFKVFESIEDDNVKINPIFVAMFFCSIEFTKKALKYTI